MRTRLFKELNYRAMFFQGNTFRSEIEPGKGFAPQRFPEIEDVSLGTKCLANCSFCYTSAIKDGVLYPNVVDKIKDYYGGLTTNERPFQVALGGGGEPTMHPEFCEVLRVFKELDILPNYTTNAMHLSPEVLRASAMYAGGVAISCHPHLTKVWKAGIGKLLNAGVKTCLHIIVGEPGSSDYLWDIYDNTENILYYVALPYIPVGRANAIDTEKEFLKFFAEAISRKTKDISFGALFYPFFQKHPWIVEALNISVYEPEVLSGYRLLDQSYKILRRSSYDLSPKFND